MSPKSKLYSEIKYPLVLSCCPNTTSAIKCDNGDLCNWGFFTRNRSTERIQTFVVNSNHLEFLNPYVFSFIFGAKEHEILTGNKDSAAEMSSLLFEGK